MKKTAILRYLKMMRLNGIKNGPDLEDDDATSIVVDVWHAILTPYSDEEGMAACIAFLASQTRGDAFWPTPGRFRSFMVSEQIAKLEEKTDHADAMWGLVRNWVRRGGDCRPDHNDILQSGQEPDWHNLRRKGTDPAIVNPEAVAAGVNACGWQSLRWMDSDMARTYRNTFMGAYRSATARQKAGDLQLSSADAKDVLGMIQRKRLTDCDDEGGE